VLKAEVRFFHWVAKMADSRSRRPEQRAGTPAPPAGVEYQAFTAGPVSRSSETAYTTVAKGVCLVPAVHLVADEPPTPSKTELIYADREQGRLAYLLLGGQLVQD